MPIFKVKHHISKAPNFTAIYIHYIFLGAKVESFKKEKKENLYVV